MVVGYTSKEDAKCELCGEKADVDFTCILPGPSSRPGLLFNFRGNVCLNCMAEYPTDFDVALAILFKRNMLEPGYIDRFLVENRIRYGEEQEENTNEE